MYTWIIEEQQWDKKPSQYLAQSCGIRSRWISEIQIRSLRLKVICTNTLRKFMGVPTPMILYPEWPHRQGGCLTCCGCTFESSWVHWFILCTRRSGGTAHEGGGCDQSIRSTVSDAIVYSWLWLTATRSSPLGCFSILQVVDNWSRILW